MKRMKYISVILLLYLISCVSPVSNNELAMLNEDLCFFYMKDKDYRDEMKIYKSKNVIFYKLENDSICFVKKVDHIMDSNYRTLRFFHDDRAYLKMKDTIESFERKCGCSVSDIFYISEQKYSGYLQDSAGIIMKDVMPISIR
jgi:hypothetical protein